jgi:hypothetical protein
LIGSGVPETIAMTITGHTAGGTNLAASGARGGALLYLT